MKNILQGIYTCSAICSCLFDIFTGKKTRGSHRTFRVKWHGASPYGMTSNGLCQNLHNLLVSVSEPVEEREKRMEKREANKELAIVTGVEIVTGN